MSSAHLTDEKTGTERLSDRSGVTQLLRDRAG